MNLKKTVVLFGLVVMMAATGRMVFAEEAVVAPAADPMVIDSNQQSTSPKETDMQWAWGEVTNLDNQANAVTLKYLDYETDQEKELVLIVDEKTTFENIKDFNELKLKDTLSIDYMVGADNKNIAKNISFEKPDISSSAPVPSEAAAPSLTQPTAQSETPVDSSIAVNEAPAPEAAESAPAVQNQVQ